MSKSGDGGPGSDPDVQDEGTLDRIPGGYEPGRDASAGIYCKQRFHDVHEYGCIAQFGKALREIYLAQHVPDLFCAVEAKGAEAFGTTRRHTEGDMP